MAKLKAIDLFCGCGGLTAGLKSAGFQVVGALDNSKVAIDTYKLNHEDVSTIWHRDIRYLTGKQALKDLGMKPGELDLVAGCPPCQGFSKMRTRNGKLDVDDKRKDFVFHFLKFVNVLRPRAVMMENVPGLASDQRMIRVIHRLKQLGYAVPKDGSREAVVQVRNAADFGVPQRRRRMILMAGRNGFIPFPEPEARQVTVREAFQKANLATPGESGDPLHDFPTRRTERIKGLIARIPKDGGSRSALGPEDQLDCHKRNRGFNDVYGRMAWDAVSPTMTGGCTNPSKGRFIHPEENRAITMREAAILQSFNPEYKFSLDRGKTGVSLMIGNAFPPRFIEPHALSITRFLSKIV